MYGSDNHITNRPSALARRRAGGEKVYGSDNHCTDRNDATRQLLAWLVERVGWA